MDRLTKRIGNKVFVGEKPPDGCKSDGSFCKDGSTCKHVKDRNCPLLRAVDRLEAYEDAIPIEAITVERDVYKRDFEAARDRAEKAEAVVPVQCGECTKWREETGWCDELSTFIDRDGRPCGPSESSNWRVFQSNDYCSYGERRENHA